MEHEAIPAEPALSVRWDAPLAVTNDSKFLLAAAASHLGPAEGEEGEA